MGPTTNINTTIIPGKTTVSRVAYVSGAIIVSIVNSNIIASN
jgi:hypothetical protein